jgi:hypothetical protein
VTDAPTHRTSRLTVSVTRAPQPALLRAAIARGLAGGDAVPGPEGEVAARVVAHVETVLRERGGER